MRSKGYAVTYAGESNEFNSENYYLNNICKEDPEIFSSYTENKDFRSRNMYAVSSAVNSDVAGADLAYIAVDVLKGFFGVDFNEENGDYFKIANNAITSHVFETGNAHFDVDCSVLYIAGNNAVVYNVGDVPVFFYRNGNIKKISGVVPDEVEIQKSYYDEMGDLQEQTVTTLPTMKHLGVMDEENQAVPYTSEVIKLKRNSYFVMCSKAVENLVSQEKISNILADKRIKERDKAVEIINCAVDADPEGNYTVVVVAVTRGIAIAQAEARSFCKWLGVAAICTIICMYSSFFGTHITNFLHGCQYLIDTYIVGKEVKQEFVVPVEQQENKTSDKENTTVQDNDGQEAEQTPEVQNLQTETRSQTQTQPTGTSAVQQPVSQTAARTWTAPPKPEQPSAQEQNEITEPVEDTPSVPEQITETESSDEDN